MIALYNLADRPASFDFVTWCAIAKTHGADHVRFVVGKWKPKNYTNPEQRFKTIVEPACKLWGLPYSIGEPAGEHFSHYLHKAIRAYHQHGGIAKIPIAVEPRDYITITLRKSRTFQRNSNEGEWMKFAKRCKDRVVIIRDFDERPIFLDDRMHLYAHAKQNLMVINGPLTLCIHSDAPYISMRTIGCEKSGSTSPVHMEALGITTGFQFPWANASQRLFYTNDTCAEIERAYEEMSCVTSAPKLSENSGVMFSSTESPSRFATAAH